MYTVKLLNKEIDFKKVDEVCSWIPSGMNVWDSPIESFDLKELKCYSSLMKLSTPTILGHTLSLIVIVVPIVQPFPACTSGIIRI